MTSNHKDLFPKFISSKPKGEDGFEGKSQEKLANIISNLIREDSLEKKVIGLNGEWGSGKSNVIELVKKNLGEDYATFVFDSWGHQEDLTRKAFLEELIAHLFKQGIIESSEDWKQKKDELLAKVSVTKKRIFPEIKPFWIVFSGGILLYLFLSGFYDQVLKTHDFINSTHFNFWKPIISVYLLPAIAFFAAIWMAYKAYQTERKKNNQREPLDQESKIQTLGRVIYWLRGDQIESKEKHNVIEDEPSVRQFRQYFDKIQNDIGSKGLIIVFDNIDRLDARKVRALWSSIHTFFTEKTYEKTWIIVPYYKEKLSEIFDGNSDDININESKGFIAKTFSLNFRVSPPIASDWGKLLADKLEEAFGKSLIPKDELPFIIQIFDNSVLDSTIKPRQIINYVNELVGLYGLWKSEIEKGEVKFRYLALFARSKDIILDNPVQKILDKEYLGASASLFINDESLETVISALTFNVPLGLADEVLLKRELINSLRNGNTEFLEQSKDHKAFLKYLKESIESLEFENKRTHFLAVMNSIKSAIGSNYRDFLWEDFAQNMIEHDGNYLKYSEELQQAIINAPRTQTKVEITSALLESYASDLSRRDEQGEYVNLIKDLKEFDKNHDLGLPINNLLSDQFLEPAAFLEAVSSFKYEYREIKIKTKKTDFKNYFYSTDNSIALDRVYKYSEELTILKNDYETDFIIAELSTLVGETPYEEHKVHYKILSLLKQLKNGRIKISLSNRTYGVLAPSHIDKSILPDFMAIGISNFDDIDQKTRFISELDSLDDETLDSVARTFEKYYAFGSLLKLIVSNATASTSKSLKVIALKITKSTNHHLSVIDFGWTMKNFDKIRKFVFNNEEPKVESFVTKLQDWKPAIKRHSLVETNESLFNYFYLKDNYLIKSLVLKSTDYFEKMTMDSILATFSEKGWDQTLLLNLFLNEFKFKVSNDFYEAYETYLEGLREGSYPIPERSGLMATVHKILDGRKLKGTFSRMRDKLLSSEADPYSIGIDVYGFFIPLLIRHSHLEQKADLVTYKLIPFLLESEKGIDLITDYLDFFISTILLSNEYLQDAKIKISKNLYKFKDDGVRNEITHRLSLDDQDIQEKVIS